MVAVLLALVAGGLAIGNAAPASRDFAPCHASSAGHHTPAVGASSGIENVALAGHSHANHDHGTDGKCPSGGSCCDALCHAVLAASFPAAIADDVTFASYARFDDASMGSLPVHGPERPPRTVAA